MEVKLHLVTATLVLPRLMREMQAKATEGNATKAMRGMR